MKHEIKVDCCGTSEMGKARSKNEDHYFLGQFAKSLLVDRTSLPIEDHARFTGNTNAHVFAVADGIGGHANGEEASEMALNTLIRFLLYAMPSYYGVDKAFRDQLVSNLKFSLTKANEIILAQNHQAEKSEGIMGSTLTMVYVLWPRAYVVHVGDSRCYLYRDGKLMQVTRDHTAAQEMIENGVLDPRKADESAWSHQLTQAIGGEADSSVNPEVYGVALRPGDALLLCTDGLSDMVDDENIARLLNVQESSEKCCATLIEAANQAGGEDNVTVVLARFVENVSQPAKTSAATVARETGEAKEPAESVPA